MRPMLVTQKWLYGQIRARKLNVFCVMDPTPASPAKEESIFAQRHIPTSRPLIASAALYPKAPVPSIAEFCEWISSQALLSTYSIVLYPHNPLSLHTYRVWWQLQYHQVRNVSVLVGDLDDWCTLGLPVEQGIPPKKASFREAHIRTDCYYYYSPRDLELFMTNVKATRAYERKRFAFKQVVYTGVKKGLELDKFFRYLTQRMQEQETESKLEELEAIEHKKYVEKRKRDRQLYYSIFDTGDLNPPQTLRQLRYLRTTSSPSSTVFSTIMEDGSAPVPGICCVPYTSFLDETGRPLFLPKAVLATAAHPPVQTEPAQNLVTNRASSAVAATDSTHDHLSVVVDNSDTQSESESKVSQQEEESQTAVYRMSLQSIFSSNRVDLNRPILFIGDTLDQTAFTVFAAALAYGGGIYQYALGLITDGFIARVNHQMDKTSRNKLIKALDMRMTKFSKDVPPRPGRTPPQHWSKSPLRGTRRNITADLGATDPTHTESGDDDAIGKHRGAIEALAAKQRIVDHLTGELLNLAPETSTSTPRGTRIARTNVYTPKYRQSDLDLIAEGIHPSGRRLTNIERFKLQLRLPLNTLESREVDYSDPSTITMILDEHVNNVSSTNSKLVSTHSRGQLASRAVSAKSLVMKFFNAHKWLEQQRREHDISNYRFRCNEIDQVALLAKDLDAEPPQVSHSSAHDPGQTSVLQRVQQKNKSGIGARNAKSAQNQQRTKQADSGFVRRILTHSSASPTKMSINHSLTRTNTIRSIPIGFLAFKDGNRAKAQSISRMKKLRKMEQTEENENEDGTLATLDEIDDYFFLLTQRYKYCVSAATEEQADDTTYSFELRHCFSETLLTPSLALLDGVSSMPPHLLKNVVRSPTIHFLSTKYGHAHFLAKASYNVLSANTVEATFKTLETKIADSLRPRLVALPSSPTDLLMRSMNICHINSKSIYDVALSIYLSAEEASLLSTSTIEEYKIGRMRHYWNILRKAYMRSQ